MEHACPHCRSENTQSARMALLEGTQIGEMSGWSLGAALGASIFPGLAGSRGRIVLRSGLAKRFALPPVPEANLIGLLAGCVFLGLGVLVATYGSRDSSVALVFGLLLGGVGAVLLVSAIRENATLTKRREESARALEALSGTWVCHRCGHEWSLAAPGG